MRFIPAFARKRLGTLGVLLALLALPAFASASEESVTLKFSSSDQIYLWISFAIGAIAIGVALLLRSQILAQDPGDEKMREVGKAIQDGAVAYLAKQGKTIGVFVVVLGVALAALYFNQYHSPKIAIFMGLSFLGGVAASYIAGYVGMMMAVAANMRTANAALTKFSMALRTAFRSGAVAGLFTVGMGLIGATLIFFLGGSDAMKYLIGFGFGGSLAALFMRVGGGIYTKAADVGADLVGKVEAGIPEDDPRNPAVIADNVGDNVGDCAGMAADVFESYEVTLVAAIVLGAATAAMFDQQTWMKLILFALMARGVGIIASIVGIFMVKGSDNVDDDPLKSISRGFMGSAAIAAVLTVGLAYFMMGGQGASINTNSLISPEQVQYEKVLKILAIRDKMAEDQKKAKYEIKAEDIGKLDEMKKDYPEEQERLGMIGQAIQTPAERLKKPDEQKGYTKLDLSDKTSPIYNYASVYTDLNEVLHADPSKPQKPKVGSIGERLAAGDFKVFKVDVTTTPPAQANQPKPSPQTNTVYFGPIPRKDLDAVVAEAQKRSAGQKIEVKDSFDVSFYMNQEGKIAAGIDDPKGDVRLDRIGNAIQLTYYKEPVEKIKKLVDASSAQSPPQMPPQESVTNMSVKHQFVPWWTFAACIFFGILMAFIFERLTDYYVSLHKKPVREVADVATAGPAPMIIQGFALGLESSFFSVIAIVACLITPLLIFNPATYGSLLLSFYGIALVGLGLLTTTGFILAMDTFGPISDNAQGVFEMSGCGHGNEAATKGIQRLDAAGNTTKALTKGFAIATAVVAATALFHSFVESARLESIGMRLDVPEIFLGLLIGAAAPFLFCAFTINAVGRASFTLINDVRDQFRNDPGIMAGTSKPNYGRCVAIVTDAAQKELLGPGILAIALPVGVAYGFSIGKPLVDVGGEMFNLTGAQALGGFLAGCIASGQLMAVLLANSGGIWDNAKKMIEDGLHGGKGTEAHKAGVVCDTVGDPFKDTAGPALNPLIKVMNLIALLLVPFIIKPMPVMVSGVITVLAVIAIGYAVYYSRRGSIGTEMAAAARASEAMEAKSAAMNVPTAPTTPQPEPEVEGDDTEA